MSAVVDDRLSQRSIRQGSRRSIDSSPGLCRITALVDLDRVQLHQLATCA